MKDYIIINFKKPKGDGSDLLYYFIEKKAGTSDFKILREIPSNYNTYIDTSITFGKTYQYRITAIFESGFEETGVTKSHLVPLEIIEK